MLRGFCTFLSTLLHPILVHSFRGGRIHSFMQIELPLAILQCRFRSCIDKRAPSKLIRSSSVRSLPRPLKLETFCCTCGSSHVPSNVHVSTDIRGLSMNWSSAIDGAVLAVERYRSSAGAEQTADCQFCSPQTLIWAKNRAVRLSASPIEPRTRSQVREEDETEERCVAKNEISMVDSIGILAFVPRTRYSHSRSRCNLFTG